MEEITSILKTILSNSFDTSMKSGVLKALERVTMGGNYYVEYFTDDNLDERRIYLSRHMLRFLVSLFVHGGIKENVGGKLQGYMNDFFVRKMVMWKVCEFTPSGKGFPFLNVSNVDLSHFQIYTKPVANDTHCLAWCLYKAGLRSLEEAKSLIGDNSYSVMDLKTLSNTLGVAFLLHAVEGGEILTVKIGKAPKRIIISLYMKHYMLCNKTILKKLMGMYNKGLFKPIENNEEVPRDTLNTSAQQTEFVYKHEEKEPFISVSYVVIRSVYKPYHVPILYCRRTGNSVYTIQCGDDRSWSGLKMFLNGFVMGRHCWYVHDLKYNWNLIKNCPHIIPLKILTKDSLYYMVTFKYFGRYFTLRDSMKYVAKPLEDFTRAFHLPEIKHRDFHTPIVTLDTSRELYLPYSIEDDVVVIGENVRLPMSYLNNNSEYFRYGLYYHMLHYQDYVEDICRVLQDGMVTFFTLADKLLQVDCQSKITLASIVHESLCSRRAYDGVYEVFGPLRDFISLSAHGGRVCSRHNAKWDVSGNLFSIDANSLYPSAISRIDREMGGFPMGPAKSITDWEDVKLRHYFVAEIRVIKIGRAQPIPFVCFNNDEGGKTYTNNAADIKSIIVVDKITLEDWIRFQSIEYEFIRGVYWDGGYNSTIGPIVRSLYDLRREYAESGNQTMCQVIKLAMNSLYGKTLTKPIEVESIVVCADKTDEFEAKNYDELLSAEIGSTFSVFQRRTGEAKVFASKNFCHIGSMILSTSKRIMNEVMNLANEMDEVVLYTDTDSLHMIDRGDTISNLNAEYLKVYGKALMGYGMEQFTYEIKSSERMIILGKKAYLHVLGEGNTECVLKGITEAAMNEYPNKVELYEKLYAGEVIPFNLAYGTDICFDYGSVITSKECFVKRISFKDV